MPVLTVSDAIEKMGDGGKEIAYLKLDVHGEELSALQQVVSSGALNNVRQLGVTFYTGPKYLPRDKSAHTYFRLVRAFQEMFETLGFRLVHYAPDGCLGKAEDPRRVYYTNFDAVWYKPKAEEEP